MDVGDADTLERGALLAPPSPSSPSSLSPSKLAAPLSPPHASHGPSVAWQILWSVAFYAPSAALPLAARLVVVYRDEALVAFGSLLRGAVFGGLQDAAILCQTLLVARIILRLRDALVTSQACYRNLLVYATCFVALALAYLWMTFACLVDLSLLLNFLPRLNRGFVTMYMEFASQFASSLKDAVTANMVVGVCVYFLTMVLWIVALLGDKVKLPAFGIPFRSLCQPPSATRSAPPGTTNKPSLQVGPQHAASSSVWSLRAVVTSLTVRTLCVSLLVSVAALHATLALDGNGSDIYFFSNAMFSLEAEPFLKTAQALQGTTTQDKDARVLHFESCIERVIGASESFLPADGGRHRDRYPLWRKTLTYKGDKRFEVHTRRGTPPNIILLNIESMRGREIGVIGGRHKKAQFNQTATPFFDALSTQGVLFRQHYTPSIQTSRTLMSSLFGVLPSYTDATAVAKSFKTKTRLHGLPQILKEALQYTTVFWSAVDLAWDHWREFFQRNGFDQLWDDKGVLTHLTQAQRDALTNEDSFSWGYHDPVSFAGLENFLEKRRADREKTPLFLDVYSITSHDPFPTPPRFSPSSNYSAFVNKHNAGYVDALNFVDQQLQKLITNLRAKKLLDNTILLIEGDHGYGRMEHGNNPTIASSRVYDEATHIPLLIIADDLLREQDKGMVIDDVSSQSDLLATVADMVGLRGFMQHGVGQSLVRKPPSVPATKEEETNMRGVIVENPYDGGTIGLRVGPDLKYVRYHSGKYFIFNLTSDPEELAPIEQGDVNDGLKDDVTKAQLLYATQVVDMTQFMYETDGFMVPPQLANKKKNGGR